MQGCAVGLEGAGVKASGGFVVGEDLHALINAGNELGAEVAFFGLGIVRGVRALAELAKVERVFLAEDALRIRSPLTRT